MTEGNMSTYYDPLRIYYDYDYDVMTQGTGDMSTGHKMASAVTLLTALRMFTNGEFQSLDILWFSHNFSA